MEKEEDIRQWGQRRKKKVGGEVGVRESRGVETGRWEGPNPLGLHLEPPARFSSPGWSLGCPTSQCTGA